MRSLTEYVKESLLKHIALEIREQDIIYEKYGLYDGCDDLVKYVKKRLQNLEYFDKPLDISYDEVADIENIIFDRLIINFKNSNDISAAYLPKLENEQFIDKNTGRFNEVEMILCFNSKSFLSSLKIDTILAHEFTHIFNDYKIQVICKGSFAKIFDTKQYRMSKSFNDKSKPKTTTERELERALYMLNEYEKNGFIASLAEEIETLKKDYIELNQSIDANQIYKAIQSTDIYKNYMNIGKYIERHYNDDLTRFEKSRILIHWNEIFDDDKTSLESIFKLLSNKFVKLKRKLESTLPKKIAEALDYEHNAVVVY